MAVFLGFLLLARKGQALPWLTSHGNVWPFRAGPKVPRNSDMQDLVFWDGISARTQVFQACRARKGLCGRTETLILLQWSLVLLKRRHAPVWLQVKMCMRRSFSDCVWSLRMVFDLCWGYCDLDYIFRKDLTILSYRNNDQCSLDYGSRSVWHIHCQTRNPFDVSETEFRLDQ